MGTCGEKEYIGVGVVVYTTILYVYGYVWGSNYVYGMVRLIHTCADICVSNYMYGMRVYV